MELILHIGAHRTGSTMVEWTVRETLAAHPEAKVALWAPRQVRDIPGLQTALSKVGGRGEPTDPEAIDLLEALASKLAQDISQERNAGTQRLIISEENFLGSMRRNLFKGTFYTDVSRRLSCLDSLLPQSPDYVAMGLREYGSVWTSAFQYSAQRGKAVPPVAEAKGKLLRKKRGWPEVVADVQTIWPDSGLYLWPQETLGDNLTGIAAALTGIAHEDVVIPTGQINARRSKGPQPVIFNPKERDRLARRYNRHLRRMRTDLAAAWVDREFA